MFSTFTGNSRRPRNVNLSGGAGNPFANTSWTPSAASNATKTVSDAQAERERRQLERQRQKAALKIQKLWRGHKIRTETANAQRHTFDLLYSSNSATDASIRLPQAFNLLICFCSPTRNTDDVQRLLTYAVDAASVEIRHIAPSTIHFSRITRLVQLLVAGLDTAIASENDNSAQYRPILDLILRITAESPASITSYAHRYFKTLSNLCQSRSAGAWDQVLPTAILSILQTETNDGSHNIYTAFATQFLTGHDMVRFETNIANFAAVIDLEAVSQAILAIYVDSGVLQASKDDLIWLLAHFIQLCGAQQGPSNNSANVNAVFTQITALSTEISFRFGTQSELNAADEPDINGGLSTGEVYIKEQLLSLINVDRMTQLLNEFANNLAQSSTQAVTGTSLLAGYILSLLHCFPNQADEVRMRLFLEEISTSTGRIPVVKFLWRMMENTSVFSKLVTESKSPEAVLQRYLNDRSHTAETQMEEQEWRIILLFLELYIFILRLSDDDDFFSGIYPSILQTNASTSKIRACSLSLHDVKDLSIFLKNTAFVLYYKASLLLKAAEMNQEKFNLNNYLGPGSSSSPQSSSNAVNSSATSPTRLDMLSLRTIIVTALKMVYERDSRKRFLPLSHWLMTDKLEGQDFIGAVILEEQSQRREEAENSDHETDDEDQAMLSHLPESAAALFRGGRASRYARLEMLRSRQQRAQRERRLAEMGPKLEILKHMPFVVPFDTRVMIFRQFIRLDQERREVQNNPFIMQSLSRHHQGQIRRGHLFEDAYNEFHKIGEGLKDPIQITFVDQFGAPEAGIDGGGVTKEFLMGVTTEAFGGQDGELGMFEASSNGLLYPNPIAVDARREAMRRAGWGETDPEWKQGFTEQMKRFEFLGRVVGKCLYEGILVDLSFAGFFLLKWPSSGPGEENNYKGSVNDLVDMDEELYQGMLRLKNYPGDVSELGLDFTVADQVSMPAQPVKTVTRKLIANGDQVYVTNDNRLLYISYMARHRLVVQPAMQTAAFLRGLRAIIPPSWLSMFNQSELQHLVGGDSSEINIDDLRRNTQYSGLYVIGDDRQEHPTIKLFWKVVEGFNDSQRRDLLKYVSSTPRAPLLGFSQLRPNFCIRDAGRDEDRLPSTSTCVNLLKLPIYTTEAALREKLLYAIQSGAGFDLS